MASSCLSASIHISDENHVYSKTFNLFDWTASWIFAHALQRRESNHTFQCDRTKSILYKKDPDIISNKYSNNRINWVVTYMISPSFILLWTRAHDLKSAVETALLRRKRPAPPPAPPAPLPPPSPPLDAVLGSVSRTCLSVRAGLWLDLLRLDRMGEKRRGYVAEASSCRRLTNSSTGRLVQSHLSSSSGSSSVLSASSASSSSLMAQWSALIEYPLFILSNSNQMSIQKVAVIIILKSNHQTSSQTNTAYQSIEYMNELKQLNRTTRLINDINDQIHF